MYCTLSIIKYTHSLKPLQAFIYHWNPLQARNGCHMLQFSSAYIHDIVEEDVLKMIDKFEKKYI